MEPDNRSSSPACLLCGRAYTGTSRPRWAFTPQGNLAGTVHTGCAVSHGDRKRYYYASLRLTLEDARAQVWSTALRDHDSVGSDGYYAAILFGRGRDRLLNGEQLGLLHHWTTGPLGLTTARAARITDAYQATRQAYREWETRRAAGNAAGAETRRDDGRHCAADSRDDSG